MLFARLKLLGPADHLNLVSVRDRGEATRWDGVWTSYTNSTAGARMEGLKDGVYQSTVLRALISLPSTQCSSM